MFYRIKLDKVEELRNGRTNLHLSKITGFTPEYISNIITGKRNLESKGLRCFLMPVCQEITKLNQKLETEGYDKVVEYFFYIL